MAADQHLALPPGNPVTRATVRSTRPAARGPRAIVRVMCGLPAEVEYRYVAGSPHGPIECTKIRCPVGHWFNGTVEDLAIGRAPASCREGAYPASPPRS